jgi:hypothetical protein
MSVDRRADLTPRALRGFQVKPLDSTVLAIRDLHSVATPAQNIA